MSPPFRINLERALAKYDVTRVMLTILDLSMEGIEADLEDRVLFTPILVKTFPSPRAWLIGDLRDTKALRAFFDDADLPRRGNAPTGWRSPVSASQGSRS